MAEFERTRERERPPIQDNPYERTLKYRKEFGERMANGPVVIRGDEREVFQARQGKLKFFLDPTYYNEPPLQSWRVFVHEIRTKSGRQFVLVATGSADDAMLVAFALPTP